MTAIAMQQAAAAAAAGQQLMMQSNVDLIPTLLNQIHNVVPAAVEKADAAPTTPLDTAAAAAATVVTGAASEGTTPERTDA